MKISASFLPWDGRPWSCQMQHVGQRCTTCLGEGLQWIYF